MCKIFWADFDDIWWVGGSRSRSRSPFTDSWWRWASLFWAHCRSRGASAFSCPCHFSTQPHGQEAGGGQERGQADAEPPQRRNRRPGPRGAGLQPQGKPRPPCVSLCGAPTSTLRLMFLCCVPETTGRLPEQPAEDADVPELPRHGENRITWRKCLFATFSNFHPNVCRIL